MLIKDNKFKDKLATVFTKKTDIQDNLTSTATDKPLSAKQGKELATMIGNAITYINQ